MSPCQTKLPLALLLPTSAQPFSPWQTAACRMAREVLSVSNSPIISAGCLAHVYKNESDSMKMALILNVQINDASQIHSLVNTMPALTFLCFHHDASTSLSPFFSQRGLFHLQFSAVALLWLQQQQHSADSRENIAGKGKQYYIERGKESALVQCSLIYAWIFSELSLNTDSCGRCA